MLGLLLALSGAVAGTARAADATPPRPSACRHSTAQILSRLNATRAAHGLRPLVVSDQLENAAVAHSRDDARGRLLPARLTRRHVVRAAPEALLQPLRATARGRPARTSSTTPPTSTPTTAIEAWLDSPPHRENMLDPDWREVGIGSLHAASRRRHVRRRAHLGDHDGLRRPHRRRKAEAARLKTVGFAQERDAPRRRRSGGRRSEAHKRRQGHVIKKHLSRPGRPFTPPAKPSQRRHPTRAGDATEKPPRHSSRSRHPDEGEPSLPYPCRALRRSPAPRPRPGAQTATARGDDSPPTAPSAPDPPLPAS